MFDTEPPRISDAHEVRVRLLHQILPETGVNSVDLVAFVFLFRLALSEEMARELYGASYESHEQSRNFYSRGNDPLQNIRALYGRHVERLYKELGCLHPQTMRGSLETVNQWQMMRGDESGIIELIARWNLKWPEFTSFENLTQATRNRLLRIADIFAASPHITHVEPWNMAEDDIRFRCVLGELFYQEWDLHLFTLRGVLSLLYEACLTELKSERPEFIDSIREGLVQIKHAIETDLPQEELVQTLSTLPESPDPLARHFFDVGRELAEFLRTGDIEIAARVVGWAHSCPVAFEAEPTVSIYRRSHSHGSAFPVLGDPFPVQAID